MKGFQCINFLACKEFDLHLAEIVFIAKAKYKIKKQHRKINESSFHQNLSCHDIERELDKKHK